MIRDDDFQEDEQDEELESADLAETESEEMQEREFYGGQRAQEKRSAEQLWLISYSDFMTIMMIFFLAMFGYSFLAKRALEEDAPKAMAQFTSVVSEMKSRMGDQIQIVKDVDKVTVELGEGVLFRSGSAELGGTAVRTLKSLGDSIRRMEGDVIVEGHTDNVPVVNGRYKSNWELSAARAFSVIQTLTQAGVPAERLAAWGFGENRPVVANDTPENRGRNRRIDIVILKPHAKNS